MRPLLRASLSAAIVSVLALALAAPARGQQGVIVGGAGPINRSMGGASTAAPLDSLGALYWNPATISGLPASELAFGAELLFPQANLSSAVPANALGPGVPPVSLAGTTPSGGGVATLPSIGLVYQVPDSAWTFGLGIFVPAGYSGNYAGSTTNPILTPPPPAGLGFGPIFATYEVLQVVPTAAVQITDRLSFGIGPSIDLAILQVDPGVFASPNANGQYPPATHTTTAIGAGFQAGLFWTSGDGWNLGTSIKSPQWFDSFHYNSVTATGAPRGLSTRLNLPLICSIGTSFTGFERWTFAGDMRFIDYGNAPGFDHGGFDPNGALTGLGWRSIFVLALGTQYQLTDTLSLRLGYTFNTAPITSATALFNVASPLLMQHDLACGFSYRLTDALLLSAAYTHAFAGSVTGPIVTPTGPIPGATVSSTAWGDSFIIGASVRF